MSQLLQEPVQSCEKIQGMMQVDMHCHSRFSDGRDDITVVVDQAKKLGIGLAVTDHNAIEGTLYACKELKHAIPGMEITSSEALDLLVYFEKEHELEEFYKKYVQECKMVQHGLHVKWYKLKWSMQELLAHAKACNAFVVLPHPDTFPPKKSINYFTEHQELVKQLDAVEGLNALMKDESNARARQLAEEWKKPFVGGSDAHVAKFVGVVVTACEAYDRASFFESVRQGKNWVVGLNLKSFNKIESLSTVMRRNIAWTR